MTYPTDKAGLESWLRAQSGDKTDPITSIHHAKAIISRQPAIKGDVRSVFIVANAHYYLISTACATKDSAVADKVIQSFTPLN